MTIVQAMRQLNDQAEHSKNEMKRLVAVVRSTMCGFRELKTASRNSRPAILTRPRPVLS